MIRLNAVRGALLACCLAATSACASAGVVREADNPRPSDEPAALTAHDAAEASNAFAIDLYKKVVEPDDNLFFSPASISLAVGFAYRGARGETASELREVMHFPGEPVEYLRAAGALDDGMDLSGSGRELRSANAFWVRRNIPLRPDYEADMAEHASAALYRTDFDSDPEKARKDINGWVADRTNDRIDELLVKGIITPATAAVLVNAIYWKGDWEIPFGADATTVAPFFKLRGTEVRAELMHQRARFQVLERGGVKMIDLPYSGGEVSMVVLLPQDSDGLPRVERNLSVRKLAGWLDDLDKAEPRETALTLPKMTLDWGVDLAEIMPAMGASTPFSRSADFSGMAQLPVPGGDPRECGLKIDHVIHQANIDVDEMGSEAAAATAVVMGIIVTGSRPPPPPPFVFRADHPFLFLLRDKRTGLILFAGRFVDPERTKSDGPSPKKEEIEVASGGCGGR